MRGHLRKLALLSLDNFSFFNSELPKLKSGAKADIAISKYNWSRPSISGRSSWNIYGVMPWGLRGKRRERIGYQSQKQDG